MAKKEDRKKQKKRLKEQKRAADRRLQVAALEHASKYPSICVNPVGGDPAFIRVIKELVAEFSFDDPTCCPQELRTTYKKLAELGVKGYGHLVSNLLRAGSSTEREARAVFEQHTRLVLTHFGEWLFEKLPSRFKESPPPTHFYRITLPARRIEVHFDLLESVEGPVNPLYVFPEKPTVLMQGARWQVGLYRHALERMCVRLHEPKGLWSYADNFCLHYRLTRQMLAYEPVLLNDGSHAIRVDMRLPLTTLESTYYADYARVILGLPETHTFTQIDDLAGVVGYLPLQIQGKYARAKTFLLPGFANTPEFALGRQKAGTPEERRLLQATTDESRRTTDLNGETVMAIKWYHDHGVPQILRRGPAPDGTAS